MAKPKKRPPIKWIKWILSAVAVLMFLLAYHLVTGPSGLLNQARLKSELRKQQRGIDSLVALKQDLEAEKQRLLTDSSYLERLARQELGMSKPKEKIYKFVSSGDSTSISGH